MIYMVKDWHDKSHPMTAQQLYERVKKDSQSNYGWLASAAELTRVTSLPSFNSGYAVEIRVMILNCFASLEQCRAAGQGYRATREIDKQAVQECYNSLYAATEHESARTARANFLTAIISVATCAENLSDFISHPGASFHDFRDKWIQAKFLEYSAKDFIDFEELYKTLRPEWLQLKKAAEDRGDFDADDRKEQAALAQAITDALGDI